MPRRNQDRRTVRPVANHSHEEAVFVFKYRSLGKLKTRYEQNDANRYALAILQAIGVAPTIPQTVGGLPPSKPPIAAPLRQSRVPTEVPGANREIVTAPAATTAAATVTSDLEGLTEEEIIALIAHHRGHSQGLYGQTRARLLVLLEFHEVSSIYLSKNAC